MSSLAVDVCLLSSTALDVLAGLNSLFPPPYFLPVYCYGFVLLDRLQAAVVFHRV